jgi:CxxC motif-containing protein (DUF1111 family)
MSSSWRATRVAVAIVLAFTFSARAADRPDANSAKATKTEYVSTSAAPDGKELFHREWIPNDPRAHGGDGLGPVFNESSCISCHNLGGSGGGGVKNVDLITAFANPAGQNQQAVPLSAPAAENLPASLLDAIVESLSGEPKENSQLNQPTIQVNAQPMMNGPAPTQQLMTPEAKKALAKQQKEELQKIHPGFISARSVVLHRFSTNENYEKWRTGMMGINQGVNVNEMADLFVAPPIQAPQDCPPPDSPQQAFPVPQAPPAVVSGTIALSRSNTFTFNAAARVATPAAATADSIQIDVVNESGEAEQKIQALRNTAQLSHAEGLQSQVGNFAFLHSKRNATALLGAGLIDRIPDSVLVEQAKVTYKDFPEIQGRIAKLKGDKIGRFGWKAQKATLYDFSMTACAVELGLDVPDQPQAGLPLNASYKAKAHDMDQPECDALVAYLRNLPAPVQLKAATAEEAKFVSAGEKQFAAVGCANCHTAKLGEVVGIYSDLLLHDMGQDLGDAGSYGGFVPNAPEEDDDEPIPSLVQQQLQMPLPIATGSEGATVTAAPNARIAREKTIGALRQEWRTPPLWGVRDSAPYLHDGRATTLEEAIAFHGGEATNSAKKFFMLTAEERTQLVAFMKTLIAPDQSASAE